MMKGQNEITKHLIDSVSFRNLHPRSRTIKYKASTKKQISERQ